MAHSKIILIAGPTASGKSALALDLARKERGTIINADAMQIYAGLPILTAQPGADEQKEIPHALYSVLDPAERSSAGKWLALAQEAIAAARAGGRRPILVGGTGLYFKALRGGLADIPDIPHSAREDAQRLYDEVGEEKFRHHLARLDTESVGRLARNDRQRLVRAYEVAKHTGKPIGYWQKNRGQGCQEDIEFEPHLLMPPRDELYTACDRRFEKMIVQGALDEVGEFLKRELDPTLPAMKTIGVREIAAYLRGGLALGDTVAKAQQATRNFAKRQMTWFRNQWI